MASESNRSNLSFTLRPVLLRFPTVTKSPVLPGIRELGCLLSILSVWCHGEVVSSEGTDGAQTLKPLKSERGSSRRDAAGGCLLVTLPIVVRGSVFFEGNTLTLQYQWMLEFLQDNLPLQDNLCQLGMVQPVPFYPIPRARILAHCSASRRVMYCAVHLALHIALDDSTARIIC